LDLSSHRILDDDDDDDDDYVFVGPYIRLQLYILRSGERM